MVARDGTSGVELRLEAGAELQKQIARGPASRMVVATQMRIDDPEPGGDPAEVSDRGDRVYEGADATAVGGLSAAGKCPVEDGLDHERNRRRGRARIRPTARYNAQRPPPEADRRRRHRRRRRGALSSTEVRPTENRQRFKLVGSMWVRHAPCFAGRHRRRRVKAQSVLGLMLKSGHSTGAPRRRSKKFARKIIPPDSEGGRKWASYGEDRDGVWDEGTGKWLSCWNCSADWGGKKAKSLVACNRITR